MGGALELGSALTCGAEEVSSTSDDVATPSEVASSDSLDAVVVVELVGEGVADVSLLEAVVVVPVVPLLDGEPLVLLTVGADELVVAGVALEVDALVTSVFVVGPVLPLSLPQPTAANPDARSQTDVSRGNAEGNG